RPSRRGGRAAADGRGGGRLLDRPRGRPPRRPLWRGPLAGNRHAPARGGRPPRRPTWRPHVCLEPGPHPDATGCLESLATDPGGRRPALERRGTRADGSDDMNGPPVLETERLRLRPMEQGDLSALLDVLGDAATMRFYDHPFSQDDVVAWIRRTEERYEQHGFGLLAVDLNGTCIGDCGPALQEVEGVDEVELGWHIRR